MIFCPTQKNLYLFGGLDRNNVTLNDMWTFNLLTESWTSVHQNGHVPDARCGHAFQYHHGKIFLFGGLKEVTKEGNDSYSFDVETHTWEEIVINNIESLNNSTILH